VSDQHYFSTVTPESALDRAIELINERHVDIEAVHAQLRIARHALSARADLAARIERAKRLQSAHHRLLRVTAVTCDACRAERAREEAERE